MYNTTCKDEYETKTETECITEEKEDCEYSWAGKGDNRVWVAIPGTCRIIPHKECKDVTRERVRPVCREVEEKECVIEPRQVCRQAHHEACIDRLGEECTKKPMKECVHKEHKKVPVKVGRRFPKTVCDDYMGYPRPLSIPL